MGLGGIRAGSAFVEIFADDSKLVRSLRGIEAKVKKTGANIGRVGSNIAGLGASVASLGGVGLGALSWPLTLASNMEQTEAAFTTLLKNQDSAKALLGDIQKFAASTPFQFDELADASKKLLAFGSSANEVTSELRRIGDIASGIGAPIGEIAEIYGKARVQGRLFAEDINQLTGRGIPVLQELAKQFGVTDSEVKKLVESGKVEFKNLEQAFVSLTSASGKFAGGMQRQSKTLGGTLSTLKDNIVLAFRPFGEVLLPAAKSLAAIGMSLVRTFGRWAEQNKAIVKPLALALGGVVAIGGAATAAGVAIIGLGAVISAVGTIGGAVATVITTIGAPVAAIIGGVVVGLGAWAGGLAYVAHQAGLILPVFDFLREGFGKVWQVASNTLRGITSALKSGDWRQAAMIAWQGIKVASLVGAQQVLEGIDQLWNNAGQLTFRFLTSLTIAFQRVFKSLPKIAFAALRGGGASLQQAMNSALGSLFEGGDLDLSANLDPAIANARQKLRMQVNAAARRAQLSEQRQNALQQPASGRVPPRLRSAAPTSVSNAPGFPPEALRQMQRQTFLMERMYQRGGLG